MWNSISLLAQEEVNPAAAAGGIIFMILYLALIVLMVASMWKVFTKAGKPGWASLIPIYNIIVLLEIVGKPTWWILLVLIPCVGVIVLLVILIELAKRFGKSEGYGVGLWLLTPIFLPMLAFGDAEYQGLPDNE